MVFAIFAGNVYFFYLYCRSLCPCVPCIKLLQYDYGSIGKENSTRQISKEATYSNRNTVHVPTATYQVRGNPLTHQGEETDDYAQGLTDTTLDTTASSDRRGIKRKTARYVLRI